MATARRPEGGQHQGRRPGPAADRPTGSARRDERTRVILTDALGLQWATVWSAIDAVAAGASGCSARRPGESLRR